MYTEFLNSSYLNVIHSAINMSPRERFMKDYDNISRKTDDEINECFLHKATSKSVDKISNSKYKRQEAISLYRKESDFNV